MLGQAPPCYTFFVMRGKLYGDFLESRHQPDDPLTDIEREVVEEIRRRIRIRSGIGYVTYPISPDGKFLQHRVGRIRSFYRKGRLHWALIEALEAIPGWSWSNLHEHSVRFAAILRRHVEQHGWLHVTSESVIEGEKVGMWLTCVRSKQRRHGLSDWLREELESIPGFTWDGAAEMKSKRYSKNRTEKNLETLRKTFAENPSGWTSTTANERHVITAIVYFRAKYAKRELSAEIIKELESMTGWSWDPVGDLQQHYVALLRDLAIRKGGLPHIEHNEQINGHPIGAWVSHANRVRRKGKLPDLLREQLEAIPGWLWRDSIEDVHKKKLALLKEYLEEFDLRELKGRRKFKGVDLYAWVGYHRWRYRTGRESPDWLVVELEKLRDWSWIPSQEGQMKKTSPQRHWGQSSDEETGPEV